MEGAGRRAGVLGELVRGEREYVRDLELLIELYLQPLRRFSKLHALLNNVASGAQTIRGFNALLLTELEQQAALKPELQRVGLVFCKLADHFKMYIQFCGAQPQLLRTVEQDRKSDRKLAALLDDVKFNNAAARGLDLASFLLKPVQRVCKYPLLLRELLSLTPDTHEDKATLTEGIAKLASVVDAINEGRRLLESFAKIAELSEDLRNDVPELDLLGQQHVFVQEGQLEEVHENSSRRNAISLLLFEDILLVGSYHKGRFRYRAHYPVGELTLGSLPSSRFDAETQERGLRIVPRGDSQLLILCPSKEVRFLWRSELQRCVEAQLFPSDKARRGAKTPQAAEAAPAKPVAKVEVVDPRKVAWEESLVARAAERQQQLQQTEEWRRRYAPKQDKAASATAVVSQQQAGDGFAVLRSESPALAPLLKRCGTGRRFEVVVIGDEGGQRSTLVDLILGTSFCATTRTSRVTRVCLSWAQKTQWNVDGTVVSSVAEARELLRRAHQDEKAKGVINVTWRGPLLLEALVIDTPALTDKNKDKIVAECTADRLVICACPFREWEAPTLVPYVLSKCDATLSRSLLVYTRVAQQLQLLTHASALREFLMQAPPLVQSAPRLFFVTLPGLSQPIREAEAQQRALLREFDCDPAVLQKFGLRRFVHGFLVPRVHQFFLEEIFSRSLMSLEASFRGSSASLAQLRSLSPAPARLRTEVTAFLGRFASAFVRGLTGDSELPPAPALPAGLEGWRIQRLGVAPVTPAVAFQECRLSAGAEIQRAVSEFRAVLAKAGEEVNISTIDNLPIATLSFESGRQLSRDVAAKSVSEVVLPAALELCRRLGAVLGAVTNTASIVALRESQEAHAENADAAAGPCIVSHCSSRMLLVAPMAQLVEAALLAFSKRVATLVAENCTSNHHSFLKSLEVSENSDLKDIAADLLTSHANELPTAILDALHHEVLDPLQDSNVVLRTLHLNFVSCKDESYFNRASFERELQEKVSRVKDTLEDARKKRDEFEKNLADLKQEWDQQDNAASYDSLNNESQMQ